MADSASYAGCRERATLQRSRGARANKHVAASKPRGDSSTKKQRKYSENLTGQAGQTTSEIGNSLAGPGRRRVGLESHRPGRAWARDFENITRWAGRGLGQAPSARPGSTPPPRVGPPAKIVGFEILDFLEFENITKRDIKRDISAIFVRNGMS